MWIMGKKTIIMRKVFFRIVVLLLVFFLISCDSKTLYDRGVTYINKGCYSKAARCFLKAAKKGHIDAQVIMGNLYVRGLGVEEDFDKATFFFRKAAENGDRVAQYNLGYCYETSIYSNKREAFNWYLKAATQGDADAQNNVGLFYYYGIGVNQDYTQAFKWFLKSANGNSSFASKYLGRCYEYGYGVQTNYQKAVDWYAKADVLALTEERDLGTVNPKDLKLWPFFYNGVIAKHEVERGHGCSYCSNEIAMLQVLELWNDMHNSRNTNIAIDVYDKSTLYYQQKKGVADIIKSKEKLFAKYPEFQQEISNEEIEAFDLGRIDGVPVRINFLKKVTTSAGVPPKEYPSYIEVLFKGFSSDSYYDFKIVTEGDYVTDKNLAKKKRKDEKISTK